VIGNLRHQSKSRSPICQRRTAGRRRGTAEINRQEQTRPDRSFPTNTTPCSSTADPRQDDIQGGNVGLQGSTQAIIKQVTDSLKVEFREMISSSSSQNKENSKLIDTLRLQQKKDSTLAGALDITSDGAKMQYIAFAKMKIGISDTREKLENHDILGALGVLEELEKITDIRLDLIKRADSCPGGWAASTIFEKKVLGDTDEKKDKLWDASVAELKTQQKSGDVPTRSRPKNRFSQRDGYGAGNYNYGAGYNNYGRFNSPFRSVLLISRL
jgi:hypothetical protein